MKERIEERGRKIVARLCRVCLFGALGLVLGSQS